MDCNARTYFMNQIVELGTKVHLLLVNVHFSRQNTLSNNRRDDSQWTSTRIKLWLLVRQENDRYSEQVNSFHDMIASASSSCSPGKDCHFNISQVRVLYSLRLLAMQNGDVLYVKLQVENI